MRAGADDPPRLVGIVPASVHATRLQPLAGSKETYRNAGKPLMYCLIDRLRRAACTDIRVVTRPERIGVITHAAADRLTPSTWCAPGEGSWLCAVRTVRRPGDAGGTRGVPAWV